MNRIPETHKVEFFDPVPRVKFIQPAEPARVWHSDTDDIDSDIALLLAFPVLASSWYITEGMPNAAEYKYTERHILFQL